MKLKIMIVALLLLAGIGSAVNRLPATEFTGSINLDGQDIYGNYSLGNSIYIFNGTTGDELELYISANGPGTYILNRQINLTSSFRITQDRVTLMGTQRKSVDGEIGWSPDKSGGIVLIDMDAGTGIVVDANDTCLQNIYIYCANTTAPITAIAMTNTSAYRYNNLIRDSAIRHPTNTNSIGIAFQNARFFHLDNVRIDGSAQTGYGLRFISGNDHGRVENVRTYSQEYGCYINGTMYTYFHYYHGWKNKQSIVVENSVEITFERTAVDQNVAKNYYGVISIGTYGSANKIDIINSCEIWQEEGPLTNTIVYGQYATNCALLGNQITTDHVRDCITVGGNNILIADNSIYTRNATGPSAGIVLAATARDIRVMDNYVKDSGSSASHAIYITSGADNYMIMGNRLSHAITDVATGTRVVEHNLIG